MHIDPELERKVSNYNPNDELSNEQKSEELKGETFHRRPRSWMWFSLFALIVIGIVVVILLTPPPSH